MAAPSDRAGRREGEFVALIALMISLVALSIDAMLPALAEIGDDLGVADENDRQQVIAMVFLGLAIGQLIYGPLSDSIGRKPAIYYGLVVFLVGCLTSALATEFWVMLVGRFLQGLGAAGPRTVLVALVRDQYEGRAMARIMSMIMAVFILVPALAPAVGQGVMLLTDWRGIFVLFFAMALVSGLWFALRQPETLAPDRRIAFTLRSLLQNVLEVCRSRTAFGYTLAAGAIFGAFVGYLVSAQQILQELYGLGALFPLYFAILSLAIGGASLANAKLVMRYGMRALCRWALIALTLLCGGFFAFAVALGAPPPLWLFMACFLVSFFCVGILFGNLNALAMEPLGHIAGVAAAVIGSITTLISLAIGASIGALYDATVLPLVGGFAALGMVALVLMSWTGGLGTSGSE